MEDKEEGYRRCAIDAIPAGEILDAIVAEKIMGWDHLSILDTTFDGYRWHAHLPSLGFPPRKEGREYKTIGGYAFWTVNHARPVPKFSTEVPEAWKVCQKMEIVTTLLYVSPRAVCLTALAMKKIEEIMIGVPL
jgi:hypothetical protein